MNFMGIGSMELAIIGLVALFVVGPKRLAEGVRSFRSVMTELRRQRDDLTSMVKEAIDVDDLKKEVKRQIDVDGIKKGLDKEGLESSLRLDQEEVDPRPRSRARPGGYTSRRAPKNGKSPGAPPESSESREQVESPQGEADSNSDPAGEKS
ncbi:MAG: twin-arginine translocase TatA/TatE family subunit [Dehalococcoidia bacterium]